MQKTVITNEELLDFFIDNITYYHDKKDFAQKAHYKALMYAYCYGTITDETVKEWVIEDVAKYSEEGRPFQRQYELIPHLEQRLNYSKIIIVDTVANNMIITPKLPTNEPK